MKLNCFWLFVGLPFLHLCLDVGNQKIIKGKVYLFVRIVWLFLHEYLIRANWKGHIRVVLFVFLDVCLLMLLIGRRSCFATLICKKLNSRRVNATKDSKNVYFDGIKTILDGHQSKNRCKRRLKGIYIKRQLYKNCSLEGSYSSSLTVIDKRTAKHSPSSEYVI